jgi:hypothetical protein
MHRAKFWAVILLSLITSPVHSQAPAPPPTPAATKPTIDLELARQYFQESRQICKRDNGRLWGQPLARPMMLVDPKTRFIVTSEADTDGLLKADHGVFTGRLPEDKNIFNTTVEWAGKRWAQVMWPVPRDPDSRREVFLHEQFHLVQHALGLRSVSALNFQVDSLEGRYLLQLEWRALKDALLSRDEEHQKTAMTDALLFRRRRHQIFPDSAESETALETIEGTAEYTGVKLGIEAEDAQVKYAIRLIDRESDSAAYSRIFAYASGPAYGLLLDQWASNWRKLVVKGYGMAEIMESRLEWKSPSDLPAAVAVRAKLYDGVALRTQEEARESQREYRFGRLRTLLVDGPVLKLPNAHLDYNGDPDKVRQYEGIGNIFLSFRGVADWGIIEVSKAALLDTNWRVVVPAPFKSNGQTLSGDGWTLQLNAGWEAVPDRRPGDFFLRRTK